jgi:hypothetical protein
MGSGQYFSKMSYTALGPTLILLLALVDKLVDWDGLIYGLSELA